MIANLENQFNKLKIDHEVKKKQEIENEKLRKAEEERLKNMQAKAAADAIKAQNQAKKVPQNDLKLPSPKVYVLFFFHLIAIIIKPLNIIKEKSLKNKQQIKITI